MRSPGEPSSLSIFEASARRALAAAFFEGVFCPDVPTVQVHAESMAQKSTAILNSARAFLSDRKPLRSGGHDGPSPLRDPLPVSGQKYDTDVEGALRPVLFQQN